MSRQTMIDEIMERVTKLKYSSGDRSYMFDVVSKENRNMVKETILSVINEYHDHSIGELQAKVFAYEQIISKSNFKPFLEKGEENE